MAAIVPVKLSLGELATITEDGALWVAFRPAAEALGLNVKTQVDKLKTRSWARTSLRDLRLPGDPRTRQMTVVDRKTFTMWLATVNENNIAAEKRPQLIAYQAEAAEALDQYWHEGGAINPSATTDQLADIIGRAEAQARVLANLRGIVDPAWLDAKARHVGALALGVEPDVDPAHRPLTVGEYLAGRGVTGTELRSLSPGFGKRVKAAYRDRYGTEPGKVDRFVDGALRPVAAYTEAHRPLFDQAWRQLLGVA